MLIEEPVGAAFAFVVEFGTLLDFLVCEINDPSLRGQHAKLWVRSLILDH